MASFRAHTIIILGLVALAAIFLLPFALTLILAIITAYSLYPIVNGLRKIFHSYNLALLFSLVLLLFPFAIFFKYVAGDITPLIYDINSFSSALFRLLGLAQEKLAIFGLERYAVGVQNILSNITDYALKQVGTYIEKVPWLLVNAVIYIFATYHFIKDGGDIVRYIKEFVDSLEREEQLLLTSIMDGLGKSFDVLFISYVTMSAITAGLAWLGYYLIGLPYAAFLGLLSGIFSFLPVFGVWMIYIPAAIYEYSLGNVNGAIYVLAFGVLVLTLATDMIIRPMLGVMKAGVTPLTVFLGFFAGPIVMGAPGIIVGPIVFVVIETVLKSYIDFVVEEKKDEKYVQ